MSAVLPVGGKAVGDSTQDTPIDANRLEALKLFADWSKWVAAIDTAAFGALFVFATATHSKPMASAPAIALCVAMAALLLSLWGACQFLFSMPGIVMDPSLHSGASTRDFKNPSFMFSLRTYHRVQYVPLYFAGIALAVLIFGIVWTDKPPPVAQSCVESR